MAIQSAKRATLHLYVPDEIWIPPERFFINSERAGAGGHRHEYDLRSQLCANPLAPTCRQRAPMRILRMDKYNAHLRAELRLRYVANIDLDYPQQLAAPEPERLMISFSCVPDWSITEERELWL